MCNFGIVEKIEKENLVSVKPLLSDSCMGCGKKCGRFGKVFVALNQKNLELKAGDTVKVRVSKLQFYLQGFFSLLTPMIFSFLGYFLSLKLHERLFSETNPKLFSFISVVIFFVISTAIVFILSRGDFKLAKPEVTEII